MIKMPGKNNFNGYFNTFEWSAPIYEDREGVFDGIYSHNIFNKEIKDIRVIGAVFQSSIEAIKSDLRHELKMQEISDDYPVDNSVSVCEPVIIEFTDGSTFEFLPLSECRVRMEQNAIPKDICDGLNRHNFLLSQTMFKDIIGKKIMGVDIEQGSEPQGLWGLFDDYYSFLLGNGEDLQSVLRIDRKPFPDDSGHGNYSISLHNKENTPQKITLIDKAKGRLPISQKYLCTDFYGGVFRIGLNQCDNKALNANLDFLFDRMFHMTFWEGDFDELFSRFFESHIVPNIQPERICTSNNGKFDWYGHNLYSFPTMRKIIADIRNTTQLINSKSSSLDLSPYRKWLAYYANDIDFHNYTVKPEERLDEFMLMIADHYERFCSYMENLMNCAKGGIIDVMGL